LIDLSFAAHIDCAAPCDLRGADLFVSDLGWAAPLMMRRMPLTFLKGHRKIEQSGPF